MQRVTKNSYFKMKCTNPVSLLKFKKYLSLLIFVLLTCVMSSFDLKYEMNIYRHIINDHSIIYLINTLDHSV